MKKTLIIAALTATSLLTGCASNSYTDAPSKMGVLYSQYAFVTYEGSQKSFDEIGIVTTDGLIKIVSVDDMPVGSYKSYIKKGFYSGGRYQLHLSPGQHKLEYGFHSDNGGGSKSWSRQNQSRVINIAAGQVIHLGLVTSWGTWTAKESDGKKALATIKADFNTLQVNE